jgi:hypothetical protein
MDGGDPRRPGARSARGGTPTAETLEKRLQLRRKAREDAGRGLPALDSTALSDTEQSVLDAIAREQETVAQARLALGAETERRLRALAPDLQDFAAPLLEAKLALRQAAARVAEDWRQATARARQAAAELNAFKQANNLRRSAAYPQSTLLQAGLLLCAAVFESLFSAALFAEDDARGLLGGAITAVGLSGANVTLGFLAGFLGLRYLQHVRPVYKWLGGAAFALFTALALMLNLFAADWRDQMAATAGEQLDLGADASFHIWSILNLQSPQAIILLMLGAGVWVFAALKGYSGFDDPYPDYGKMARAAAAAEDEATDLRSDAREEFEGPIEEAKTALSVRLEAMRRALETMNAAFDEAAAQSRALDSEDRALRGAASSAIRLYREENAQARGGAQPAYFASPLFDEAPRTDELASAAAAIDEGRTRLAQAQTEAARALEDLLSAVDEATAKLDGESGS